YRRTATPDNLADVLSIPLFIKLPGQQTAVISDENVESIDIFPTIASVLGINLKLAVDGKSLLDVTARTTNEKRYYANAQLHSIPPSIIASAGSAAELRSRFGSAPDRAALYQIGPYPQLVGKSVEELPVSANQPVEIELNRSGTFYSTDP